MMGNSVVEFNADEWAKLALPEQVHWSPRFAQKFRKLSLQAPTPLKEEYAGLADQWELFADSMEFEFLKTNTRLKAQ
jgi:hypothetical protein